MMFGRVLEELALCENDIENLSLRYVTLRRTNGVEFIELAEF